MNGTAEESLSNWRFAIGAQQRVRQRLGGWMPIVYGGIPCDARNTDANSSYKYVPAFGGAAAPTADVNWLQRCVIIEGLVPRLGLVRP